MARCTPILMILLAVVPIYFALDCRKFSFAPACRGIMLKRSGAHALVEQPATEGVSERAIEIEVLSRLLRSLEEVGASKDCINANWLREKILTAKIGTLDDDYLENLVDQFPDALTN